MWKKSCTYLNFQFFFLFLLVSALAPSAFADPSVILERHFEFEVCEKGACSSARKGGPTQEVHSLELKKLSGKGGGWDGWLRDDFVEQGIRFRSEIHVMNSGQPGSEKYYLYLMLRSGPTLKRHGRVRKIHLVDLATFQKIDLADEPITMGEKTLRAHLVLRSLKAQ